MGRVSITLHLKLTMQLFAILLFKCEMECKIRPELIKIINTSNKMARVQRT